jgi:hypothetical protein
VKAIKNEQDLQRYRMRWEMRMKEWSRDQEILQATPSPPAMISIVELLAK